MMCLRLIAKGRSLDVGFKAAIAFADNCQTALQLVEWPARSMCANLTTKLRYSSGIEYGGVNCSVVCLFGKVVNGSCKCKHGYWGEKCTNVCPGGVLRPCHGQGFCLGESGNCHCDWNWMGDSNCSSCTQGYYGRECFSVFPGRDNQQIKHAEVFANNFLLTFDHVVFKIQQYGEFSAFYSRSRKLQVQMRYVQRYKSFMLGCVALRLKTTIVVIHAGLSGGVTVTVNDKRISVQETRYLVDGYRFYRKSFNQFVIKASDGFQISVYNNSRALSLSLAVHESLCRESLGLFGNCSSESNCDPAISHCNTSKPSYYPNANTTAEELALFIKSLEVSANESLFTNTLRLIGNLYQTKAQTCLFFNRTGIITSPLFEVFNGDYVSIQLMVKTTNPTQAGTILSFTSDTTLSINLEGTVKILRQNLEIDSKLEVLAFTWSQLTLVYHKKTGVLQLFTKSDIGLAQSFIYVVGTGWFDGDISMGVGLSHVSPKSHVSLRYPLLFGLIDDIKIWNIRLDSLFIEESWRKDFRNRTPGLKAAWKMDEGTGLVVHDTFGVNNMKMPPSGWIQPIWTTTDYMLLAQKSKSEREWNAFIPIAGNKCKELLYNKLLQKTCVSIMNNLTSVYYQACVEKVLVEKTTDAADEVLLAYSSACMDSLELDTNPALMLCELTANKRIGEHFGKNCTKRCVYGDIVNGKCLCLKGYWGINCTKKCPGGASSPCGNNGVCLQGTGKCLCSHNWRGNSNCSKCTVGWKGQDCSYAEVPTKNSTRIRCLLRSYGQLITFNDEQHMLVGGGTYAVVNSTVEHLFVEMVPCLQDSFCPVSVSIRHSMKNLTLRRTSSKPESQVSVNGKQVDLELRSFHIVSLGFSIHTVSRRSYRIVISDRLTVDVSTSSLYYEIKVKSHSPTCKSFNGICGSCLQGSKSNLTFLKPVLRQLPFTFAKFALFFSQATLYSKELHIFSGNYVTVDFLIKSCEPHICGGPIFTYAALTTVYISNFITLKILIGNDVYDTGLKTPVDIWSHVFVTLSKVRERIDVYLAVEKLKVYYRSFKLKEFPFVNGGVISLGSWTPSLNGKGLPPFRTFVGEIDEVRVWEMFFDFPMVRQRIFSNLNRPVPGLVAAWKLDEGEGLRAKDLIAQNDLLFPQYPMGKPDWRVSTAPISTPIRNVRFVDDTPLRVSAQRFCEDIFLNGHVGLVCKSILNETKQFFVSNCIAVVLKFQKMSAAVSVIAEYADVCQDVMSLDDWPARRLCNIFLDVKLPGWIGENCTVKCDHGSRSHSNSEVCVCHSGYWGAACNETCDGGFSRPCSNHGICDLKTGKCTCQSNWMGNSICSECTSGKIGDDCSVSSVNKTTALSKYSVISLKGHIIIFGGYGIVLRNFGEYRLLFSSLFDTAVYGRFVPCYDAAPCLNSLVIKSSALTMVVHAPFHGSDKIIIWLNGRFVDIYRDLRYIHSHKVKILQRSVMIYSIRVAYTSYDITVVGAYLDVIIAVPHHVCRQSYGLLGNCGSKNLKEILGQKANDRNCSTRQFATNNTAQVPSLNETYINQFFDRHKIELCESSFIYEFNNIREYREANSGFALRFNSSSLVFLNPSYINSKFLTIDFMIFLENDGVILSYGSDVTFLLVTVRLNLQIWIGDNIFKTKLYLESKSWNQIILQWDKETGNFTVFIFDRNGLIRWQKLHVGNKIIFFNSGGIFGIGQWQPAFNNSFVRPNTTFVGLIEQFRVWEREFSPAVIWQLLRRELRSDSWLLTVAIDFDNFEAGHVVDKVTKKRILLVKKPWMRPTKELSSVTLKKQLAETKNREVNLEWIGKADEFCQRYTLSGELGRQCTWMGQGVSSFYYRLCRELIVQGEDLHLGLQSIVSFADYCKAMTNLTIWPAKHFCSIFNLVDLPEKMRFHCNEDCVYGTETPEKKCLCAKGFWGANCSDICPGGALRPCSDNGVCASTTGKCYCSINWDGDAKCGACTKGWIGKQCGVAKIETSFLQIDVSPKSYLFDGSVVLFSRNAFRFNHLGMFQIYSDEKLLVDIQCIQTSCYSHKICVSAIFFKIMHDIISIKAPTPETYEAVTLINNRTKKLSSLPVVLTNPSYTTTIRLATKNKILIEISSQQFAVVRVFRNSLSIAIEANRNGGCTHNRGILMTCFNETSILSAKEAAEALYRRWHIPKASVESVMDMISFTSAEYALLFDNTGAVSNPLCNAFRTRGDYSIEFLVKPINTRCMLLSYSLTTTFAVYIQDTFRIVIDRIAFDSNIKVVNNTWHHVTMIWWSSLKRFEIYVFFENKHNNSMERRTFTLYTDPFYACGILTIGQWLPSVRRPNGIKSLTGTFFMDEIRVWNRTFDPLTIQQNFKMNVLKSYSNLTALWKFNELDGDILRNLVYENESLYTPSTLWQRPVRVLSSATIKDSITDALPLLPQDSLNLTAPEQHCKSLFYEGELNAQCHNLSSLLAYFYSICVKDVTLNDASFSVDSVVIFADICKDTLGLTLWPAKELCNRFAPASLPIWIGGKCNRTCVFGKADPKNISHCLCDEGYWGANCSRQCPGGALNACSGNGRCATTDGFCLCSANWNGNVNCSSCGTSWTGLSCDVVIEPFGLYKHQLFAISFLTSSGFLTTFNGYSFDIRVTEEVILAQNHDRKFLATVKFSPCTMSGIYHSRCLTFLSLRYRDLKVVVRAPYLINTSYLSIIAPILIVDGKTKEVDHVTFISTFARMIRRDRNIYELIYDRKFEITIAIRQSLEIIFKL